MLNPKCKPGCKKALNLLFQRLRALLSFIENPFNLNFYSAIPLKDYLNFKIS